jgi:hypothetical protein
MDGEHKKIKVSTESTDRNQQRPSRESTVTQAEVNLPAVISFSVRREVVREYGKK